MINFEIILRLVCFSGVGISLDTKWDNLWHCLVSSTTYQWPIRATSKLIASNQGWHLTEEHCRPANGGLGFGGFFL